MSLKEKIVALILALFNSLVFADISFKEDDYRTIFFDKTAFIVANTLVIKSADQNKNGVNYLQWWAISCISEKVAPIGVSDFKTANDHSPDVTDIEAFAMDEYSERSDYKQLTRPGVDRFLKNMCKKTVVQKKRVKILTALTSKPSSVGYYLLLDTLKVTGNSRHFWMEVWEIVQEEKTIGTDNEATGEKAIRFNARKIETKHAKSRVRLLINCKENFLDILHSADYNEFGEVIYGTSYDSEPKYKPFVPDTIGEGIFNAACAF
jgi:hypothetical protein